eukprot:TRINITY_DN3599_c0_g1_i1.p1 TRINITY_DN3599_c0_g1~~TRINITY_DN3599_c0_g1_i1.p1  ORF type:complete len:267 (-),score=75.55 TRINITY_DN3599_c0_g1_i1:199-888(-)
MGRDLKVTVVGDTSVGKTSLLISYTTNTFPGEHVPTVFDNYSANAIVDGEPINLGLWDTAGSNEYDELRPLSYPGTDAFIVCYSIIDEVSLTACTDRWIPEIEEHCSGVPIILVGTKNDLRSKPDIIEQLKAEGSKPVTLEKGKEVAVAIKAYKYIECSALTQENLQLVFQETIRSVINPETSTASSSKKDDGKKRSHKSGSSKKKHEKKSKAKKEEKKKTSKRTKKKP